MSAPAVIAPYVPPGSLSAPKVSPPYAFPLAPTGVSSGWQSTMSGGTGPFVPAAWRGQATTVAQWLPTEAAPIDAVADSQDEVVSAPNEAELLGRDYTPPPVEPLVGAGRLPWIDAFLRSTPPAPMRAVPAPDAVASVVAPTWAEPEPTTADLGPVAEQGSFGSYNDTADVDDDLLATSIEDVQRDNDGAVESPVIDAASDLETIVEPQSDAPDSEPSVLVSAADVDPAADAAGEPIVAEATPELWPLEDAAVAFRDLSAQLGTMAGHDRADGAAGPEEMSSAPVLAPWQDDDFVDIMPMPTGHDFFADQHGPSATADTVMAESVDDALPVATALFAPMDVVGGAIEAQADDAARALEQLAQRMRSGELSVPSYDPQLGEQAVLVAALAAILGVRSR